MVVKLNGRPIEVQEDVEKDRVDWAYLSVCGIGTLLMLWVVDYAAVAFLGIHAFPFIKFVGVILKWVGIY